MFTYGHLNHVYYAGTIGFVGTSYFVKKIYSTVKID